MIVCSPIFVADTKIIFRYDFVAPLNFAKKVFIKKYFSEHLSGSWRNTMLPCKHMLALFDHIKYISWNFNLEEEIILTLQVQENELQIANNGLDQKFHLKRLRKLILLEIPRKVYREKSRALAYREILNKIKSLTFVIYNGEAFEKFEEQLLDIVESFDKSAPTDSGLILEPGKTYQE